MPANQLPMFSIDAPTRKTIETLYSDHHGWLKSWLRYKLGDAFLAADLVQDTFTSVLTSGAAETIHTPRPYLVTIARRLMSHRHRRQLLETEYLEILTAMPETQTESPEARMLALEALQQIDRALDSLSPIIREAFLLCQFEELSYKEIATRLNVSMSSVKQYLTKANRQCLFAIQL